MGKKSKSAETEALFTPIKTTDDDDDEDVELAPDHDGGPATRRYRDDPQATSDDGGPPVSFSDDPIPSIFDWGDDGNKGEKKDVADGGADMFDDFDTDPSGFSPVSLHDDSSDDVDVENGDNGSDGDNEDDRIRRKANKLINQRVFDDTGVDDEDDRIFVGGGWGRHGSQFSWCPNGLFSCCRKKKNYSYGPPPESEKKGYSLCQLVCFMIAFYALVIGAGYVGYEAGLPVMDADEDAGEDGGEDAGNITDTSVEGEGYDEVSSGKINYVHHPHTKGEEWLKWVEHEKEDFHMPQWFKNFTFHTHHHKDKVDDEEAFKKSYFEPKTQSQLLHLSEEIFQSCSERSLKTTPGRNECVSQCHGHYCCFERDADFGSCVAQPNSYCFAYAACENVITDFEMNNANIVDNTPLLEGTPHDGQVMNAQDVQLLTDTCSEENIATLEGMRDCSAFCQHHMCCFNDLESENCMTQHDDHEAECEAYGVCKILADGPEDVDTGDIANTDPGASATNAEVSDHAFKEKTQTELLQLSQNIFESCTVKSVGTDAGRNACLSLCHGHFCCFEEEVEFGSCVAQPNSYCFAYAACENIVSDFEMDNANNIDNMEIVLNAQDVKLLSDTCSKENIASLMGIRDCTAFCQHHMCCFNDLWSENCMSDHVSECEAYVACQILVDGPGDVDAGSVVTTVPGAATNAIVVDHVFKETCMQSNLHKNWDICKAHCSRYECCFRSVDSCYTDQALECDEYYICEEFYLYEQTFGELNQVQGNTNNGNVNNNNQGSNQDKYDPNIAHAVQAVCRIEDKNPGDDAWVTACHALCADYLCCFSEEGTESNCQVSYGNAVCNAYAGCSVLHTTSSSEEESNENMGNTGNAIGVAAPASSLSEQEAIDEVTKSCVAKARRDPWQADQCRQACDRRSCCFIDGVGNCSRMNKYWCDEFEACEVLYSGL